MDPDPQYGRPPGSGIRIRTQEENTPKMPPKTGENLKKKNFKLIIKLKDYFIKSDIVNTKHEV